MNFIRFYREKCGLTQNELAKRTNVSEKSIRRYESALREPRASDIKTMAEVLGTTESELLSGPEEAGEIKFSFVMDIKEVESMDVKMNEFKLGTGDNDIFGVFRVPKDLDINEIGRRFVNRLKAEMVGDKVKRDELKRLEGQVE